MLTDVGSRLQLGVLTCTWHKHTKSGCCTSKSPDAPVANAFANTVQAYTKEDEDAKADLLLLHVGTQDPLREGEVASDPATRPNRAEKPLVRRPLHELLRKGPAEFVATALRQ